MRFDIYAKGFFFLTILFMVHFIYLAIKERSNAQYFRQQATDELQKLKSEYFTNEAANFQQQTTNELQTLKSEHLTDEIEKPALKYILQWTNPKNVPFVYMGVGQQGFIDRKCPYTNCYVTGDRNYLEDYTKFDLIIFAGPEVVRYSSSLLPARRGLNQKFVFASIESAANYPVCHRRLDGFFNWTWTYKLDSDARWGYIVVRDANHKVIGPNTVMHWMKLEDMDPVDEVLKSKIQSKSKAAAWFVSNCFTKSKREVFVEHLKHELEQYSMTVDIYGNCGPLKCGRDKENECNEILEKDYYFYLSFENSFSEDYVTEKLLHALKNNVVPIVYGGANYSRFMPDGIYLNARELGAEELAKKMYKLINNKEEYYEYFRWRNHYSYHRRVESLETEDYCFFCTMLNDEDRVRKKTVYEDFKKWWTPPDICPG